MRPLHVVTAIFNPFRYESHYANYRRFAKHMEESGVILTTVEMAFGERPFVVTEADNPRHIQVRGNSVLWLKENLLNLGVQRLPHDWAYAAWIDADVTFQREGWAEETVHALQHHPIVQPWSDVHDLGPQMQTIGHHKSFGRQHAHRALQGTLPEGYGAYGHPGYAWAITRQAWDHVGGLLDTCIVGSADYHMAWALLGHVDKTYALNPVSGMDGYAKRLVRWQESAVTHLRRDLGYVEGSIRHHFHGPKANRRYNERWEILTKNAFDPDLDIKKNAYGVFELTGRNIGLRDDLRAYFLARNDDANTL